MDDKNLLIDDMNERKKPEDLTDHTECKVVILHFALALEASTTVGWGWLAANDLRVCARRTRLRTKKREQNET
jgi:hypothetical protein